MKWIFITLLLLLAITTSIMMFTNKKTKSTTIEKKYTYEELLNNTSLQKATLAGGCFWCIESAFESLPGVVEAISGFAGGSEVNPTYEQVAHGQTSHREAVQIFYKPEEINFAEILEMFWQRIEPTNNKGQFTDIGFQYTTAIYYQNKEEKNIAEKSKQDLSNSSKFTEPIVTEILPFTTFYPAEEYHQDFYKKSSLRYKTYEAGSGRLKYFKDSKNADDTDLKSKLTPLQYQVTQEDGTEPAFNNKYWNNEEAGIYVDIVSGEPLFSSLDKFKSGTGWPSFTKPLESSNIKEHDDNNFLMKRTEVRSTEGDSHLGHLFNDGPEPTGERYCINSAALKFIPVADLEKEGYKEYLKLFK